MAPSDPNITRLLAQWRDGDAQALNQLIPCVYADLRAMAARRLAEHRGHDTLQPTALVHDMVLKLIGGNARDMENRQHFFNFAGRIMRQLLVDRARSAAAEKHGGGMRREAFGQAMALPLPQDIDIADLDEALTALEALEPRMARIVELRWFVGLSVAEVARALDVDERTIYRDWAMAKAWLRDHIGPAR